MKYWIGIASRDHVKRGMEGGFCQVCHGKKGPLSKMKANDWIIYYSPVKTMVSAENKNTKDNKLQSFVAIGQLKDDRVYQFEMFPGFIPFRRDVNFLQDINEVSFQELKPRFDFVKENKNLGFLFRRGLFEINLPDFQLIHDEMTKGKK
jgi:hypothetical protein